MLFVGGGNGCECQPNLMRYGRRRVACFPVQMYYIATVGGPINQSIPVTPTRRLVVRSKAIQVLPFEYNHIVTM